MLILHSGRLSIVTILVIGVLLLYKSNDFIFLDSSMFLGECYSIKKENIEMEDENLTAVVPIEAGDERKPGKKFLDITIFIFIIYILFILYLKSALLRNVASYKNINYNLQCFKSES